MAKARANQWEMIPGLRSFHDWVSDDPSPLSVCPDLPTSREGDVEPYGLSNFPEP